MTHKSSLWLEAQRPVRIPHSLTPHCSHPVSHETSTILSSKYTLATSTLFYSTAVTCPSHPRTSFTFQIFLKFASRSLFFFLLWLFPLTDAQVRQLDICVNNHINGDDSRGILTQTQLSHWHSDRKLQDWKGEWDPLGEDSGYISTTKGFWVENLGLSGILATGDEKFLFQWGLWNLVLHLGFPCVSPALPSEVQLQNKSRGFFAQYMFCSSIHVVLLYVMLQGYGLQAAISSRLVWHTHPHLLS